MQIIPGPARRGVKEEAAALITRLIMIVMKGLGETSAGTTMLRQRSFMTTKSI